MNVTPIELKEWANSLATQELLNKIKEAKQDSMEKWSSQGYPSELSNSYALGGIAFANEIIDFIEENKNA
jgi:hypothetical protein